VSERNDATVAFLAVLSFVVLGYGVFTYYPARAVGALERSAGALEARVPDDRSSDGDPDAADPRWGRLDDEDAGLGGDRDRGEERNGEAALESDRTD